MLAVRSGAEGIFKLVDNELDWHYLRVAGGIVTEIALQTIVACIAQFREEIAISRRQQRVIGTTTHD